MAPHTYFHSEYHSSPKEVKPLLDISLSLIANNAQHVESLCGFPSLVGEKIFGVLVKNGRLSDNKVCEEYLEAWETFLEAYPDLILPKVSLTHSLLVINEFLEPLCAIVKYVVEADFSYNSLGTMHDLLLSLSHAERLKKLSLRRNGLNDFSIQKITMPVRKFECGPLDLEELDLSGNPQLTDQAIVHLSGFKKLRKLNMSGTSISEAGFQKLEALGLSTCSEEEYESSIIQNVGWASPIIKQWKEVIEEKRKRKLKPLGIYGLCRSHKLYASSQEKTKAKPEPYEKKCYFKRKEDVAEHLSICQNPSAVCEVPRTQKYEVPQTQKYQPPLMSQNIFEMYKTNDFRVECLV